MKLKTLTYLAFVALMLPSTVFADEPTIADRLNEKGSVKVEQPEALNSRLKRHVSAPVENSDEETIAVVAHPKVRAGYRIQVFDDNNVRTAKQEAQNRKQQIESRFPEFAVYVSFNSPYWKVKVGDFVNRAQAEAVMAEIKHAFPSMAKSLRIIRDRINHDAQ